MNDCESVRAWLSAYIDGEITSRRREEIDTHLAGCEVCRRELASLRQVSACLQVWPAPEVNPELSTRFADRLAERTRRSAGYRPFAIPWLRAAWMSGVAACLALAVFVYLRAPSRLPVDTTPPVVSKGGNDRPVDIISPRTDKGREIICTTPSAAGVSEENKPVKMKRTSIVHHHRTRPIVASLPDPAESEATDEYYIEAEEIALDPALTAMNALTETPVAVAELPAIYPAPDGTRENLELMSKAGVDTNLPPPSEDFYEHQPAALAFALLAEAP